MNKQNITRREALQLIGVSAAMPAVLNNTSYGKNKNT